MLNQETKRKIDNCRNILVGKVPDPKAQVEQITTALIYKFMDDMDKSSIEMGGKATFFISEYDHYSWTNLLAPQLGGHERLNLYVEAITKLSQNPHIPQLFRDIFKDAFLPYRDAETLRLFLKEINEFTYDHSEKLGDSYEYLLSIMSSQGAAGQFRTPRNIIDFIVEIVEPQKDETILDPACGTAGFLISGYKHILEENKDKLTPDEKARLMNNLVGYDISPDMVRISLVNMYLHDFPNPNIYEYDTLTSEKKWDEHYDVIMANPPFMTPKGGIRPHNRFSVKAKRSEVLFVDYIAEHLNPGGKAGVIIPEGIIFQTQNAYKQLRKMLVEENYLYGVVSLPSGVFNPYSGVKTSILLMDKNIAKKTDNILFIKVENDGYDLGAQRREIDKNDLPQALEIIRKYKNEILQGKKPEINEKDCKFANIVKKEKIAEDDNYFLLGERYRESIKINYNFKMVELSSVTDFISDGNWIESKDQSKDGIRLIQTGNIGLGEYVNKIDKAKYISEQTFKKLNCIEVEPDDILVSRLPDPVGRACLAPYLRNRMITAVDCTIIRFKREYLLPELFVFYTRGNSYYDSIKQYITGSSRQRISRKNLEKINIPLPPLEVQKEIVAELDRYQKIINGAKQVVENYKPSIKINNDCDIVNLSEIADFKRGPFGGSLKKEIFVTSGYKVYEQKHAINNNLEIGEYYITKEKYNEMIDFAIKPGDFIISCSGTMGKIAIVPDNAKKGIINQALLKLTPKKNMILPMFLKLILENESIQNKYFRNTQGAAIQNVSSVKVLKTIKIPLPLLDVQKQIINQIEEEQKAIEHNKKLIEIFENKIKEKISEVWGK